MTVVGCLLLFQFGIPVDVDPKGTTYLVAEQADEAEIAKAKRYLSLGRLGISLIAIGSFLQIWAVWAQ
jgi:hypothetical protein